MNQAERFFLDTDDGERLAGYRWGDVTNPKAIIQITHGMAEHSGRYHHFANALNQAGFLVYAHDHRGHGQSASSLDKLGHFADEDGWYRVVKDLYMVTRNIKERHPELPLFLLGHSMGSFITRHNIALWGDQLSGVILSGTGSDPGILGKMGLFIAQIEGKIRAKDAKSYLLNTLSFGGFNKRFKPVRTPFDWLTRDQEIVDYYMNDPCCGQICSVRLFQDLLTGLNTIHQREMIHRIPRDLPILFISGGDDPVGDFTKGVKKVYRSYQKAGISDVTLKLYPEARHEVLNELNRNGVYHDVIIWIKDHLL